MKKYTLPSIKGISYLLLFFLVGSLMVLSSCKKDDEFSGTPVITQVRLINPAKKDSTFTQAFPGTQILIEGQNLGGAKNVYFNDFPASFNSVYNTNNNLIVTIPSNTPTAATKDNLSNQIRVVTSNGETTYNFNLEIPPPQIEYIVNENALPGSTFTVVGKDLWRIEKVIFPGNVEVTSVKGNEKGTQIELTMPDLGTASGPVTIQGRFGTVVSKGPVNKFVGMGMISNLTASWETGEPPVFNWAWWGAVRTNDAEKFPGTRGSYLQSIFGGVGADNGGWWNDNRAGNFDPVVVVNASELSKSAANYALKFEVNTKEPWTTAICLLRFGDNFTYRWMPFQTVANNTFDTKNTWQTVTVPLSMFKGKGKNSKNEDAEGLGAPATSLGSLLTADGKAAFTYRIISEEKPIAIFNTAFDNFRIVELK